MIGMGLCREALRRGIIVRVIIPVPCEWTLRVRIKLRGELPPALPAPESRWARLRSRARALLSA